MNVAVVDAVDDYIDQSSRFAFQEFDVLRMVKDQVGALDDLEVEAPVTQLKLQYRDLIRDRITDIKSQTQVQYHELFEHTGRENATVEDCLDDCLASDPFYPHVAETAQDAYAEDLTGYLRSVSEAMAPLLRADGGVWDAVRATCDRQEATERLSEPFRRSRVIAAHEDAIAMVEPIADFPLPMGPVDYTQEARRIFERGEDYIHRVIADDVRRAFDEA